MFYIQEQIDFKVINHRFIDKYQALGYFVGRLDEFKEHFHTPQIVGAEAGAKRVIKKQLREIVIDSKLEHIRFRLYREA